MKKLTLLLAFVMASVSGTAFAATITIEPFEYSSRTTNWDQNIESESGAVTKSGSYSSFSVAGGTVPWNQGTWLFTAGSFVEVAFSVVADTLHAQFEADSNDGIAEFWVDGSLVGSVDTYNRGWFQARISDLTLGMHTLRVVSRRNQFGQDDLAFDTFGARQSAPPIPLPAGAPLLLTGLGGLLLAGRKRRRKD